AGFETARLLGFGLSTGALGTLWAGQAMAAHNAATGEIPAPRRDHKIELGVTRMFTLAPRLDDGQVRYLRDWTVSLIAQPAPRVHFGVADMGFHLGGAQVGNTAQVGLRAGYRVFDRNRLWLTLSGGAIGQ